MMMPGGADNPRLFRPFELIVRLMPLPRYGSLDPTPFVAVFFPMFFGLILGDVGYGLALAALGLVLRARSRPNTPLRSVAEIAGPCAAFSIIFGFLFGEFFGDLGQRRFGMRPWLNREEAVVHPSGWPSRSVWCTCCWGWASAWRAHCEGIPV